jgi:hypothetical protein
MQQGNHLRHVNHLHSQRKRQPNPSTYNKRREEQLKVAIKVFDEECEDDSQDHANDAIAITLSGRLLGTQAAQGKNEENTAEHVNRFHDLFHFLLSC